MGSIGFIFGIFIISGIADNLPVFSCVFGVNSLIINTIHFCRLWVFLSGTRFLDFKIYRMWAVWVLWFCGHIGFIVNFRFVSGVFMGFDA